MKKILTDDSSYIQYKIVEYIEKSTKRDIQGYTNLTLEGKCYRIFDNFRIVDSNPQGIKLTTWGKNQMTKLFHHYKFDHADIINGKVLLKLDAAMEWPYYVNQHKLIFFNETDAAWYRLNGQNLQDYVNLL